MRLREAGRCDAQKVMRSPRDGDMGAVFGLGFPPFLGGPFHYMDKLGAAKVVATFQRLAALYGARFTPCQHLLQMAEQGETFWVKKETDFVS